MPAQLTNAVLSGLVSINAISNDTNEYGALFIGAMGAVFYWLGIKLYARYKIDDPVEAVQVHLLPGLWGLLAVGIFSKETGLLFSGSTEQIQIQLLGSCVLIAWALFFSTFFFWLLNSIKRLRVSQLYEVIGIDLLMHSSIHDLQIQRLNVVGDSGVNQGSRQEFAAQ